MFILFRTIVYASLFIALVLIYLPARFLTWSGMVFPSAIGVQQITGIIFGAAGGIIALWCVLAFATIGKGTPAPFDPPRRLLVRGPYRYVRNPMYIGAAVALASAALFYESLALLAYTGLFILITHLFVLLYEEPNLRGSFGKEYEAYCRKVKRWWPNF
jgi:protein-S-isoprenylcysteine O-methyltransferase Ste14